MKYLQFVLTVLLGMVFFFSCSDDPLPEPNNTYNPCLTCPCLGFDSTAIIETFSSDAYGAVFHTESYTSMSGKYADYTLTNTGSGVVDVIPVDAIWQADNTNFSGEILRFADADILFDYSDYPSLFKTISFDVNLDLGDYSLKVNGTNYDALPSDLILNSSVLSQGHHLEISGPISTIELGGWELAIDSMCLADYTPVVISNDPVCFQFEGSTFNTVCPMSQTTFGNPFLTTTSGISFRCKYVDYLGFSMADGSVFWGAPNAYGEDANVNFDLQLLQVNNCDLEVNFTNLPYTNKKVSFDLSNIWPINNPNEYQVNGSDLSTLPVGIVYTIVPLGNASNGEACYRVGITGPINTIALPGWEMTYDNLCVEEI